MQDLRQKIVVLGTGGTIAGLAAVAAEPRNYVAAQKPVADLLAGLPPPAGCEVLCEQVAQVDSKDMDLDVWQRLLRRCQYWLGQAGVRGIVITHGTDTLEETAYLLQSVLAPAHPVVLTCAMRPANAVDADGPRNLADALRVAASDGVRGVLAVCAGKIHAAVDVRKSHTDRLDAFDSGEAGPVGEIGPHGVRWRRETPATPEPWRDEAVQTLLGLAAWPRVEIVMSHALANAALVDALADTQTAQRFGAPPLRGIVVAGTGNGTVHHALQEALRRAAAAGVRIVRATRCANGHVVPSAHDEFPDSQGLPPLKARIALMLALVREMQEA